MLPLNEALKALRLLADPPISGRMMAQELSVTSSAYHFYESKSGFKGRVLPLDLARRIASVLAKRGIDPARVMALAGVDEPQSPPSLSHAQEEWLSLFNGLTPPRRKLVASLAKELMHTD